MIFSFILPFFTDSSNFGWINFSLNIQAEKEAFEEAEKVRLAKEEQVISCTSFHFYLIYLNLQKQQRFNLQ